MQEHFFDGNRANSELRTRKSGKADQKGVPRIFVCGTNAYNPKCRYYKVLNGEKYRLKEKKESLKNIVFEKEVSGKGFCPYDPKHNSTFIYAGL